MTNKDIYTAKTQQYADSRPGYAPEAVNQIFTGFLREGDTAADIGSGTGILSKEFLMRGYDVYCVEPNDAMRAEAEKLYGQDPHFRSVAAAAENTGLPAGSISLVTAASAFHWFDTRLFYKECRRILKPAGIVCILFNARVYDDFTKKQHALTQQYSPRFTSFVHGTEKALRLADTFFPGEYKTERFAFPLSYTKESFIERSFSSSYAPEKGTAEYTGLTRDLRHLLDSCFPEEEIVIANETLMIWGRLDSSASL